MMPEAVEFSMLAHLALAFQLSLGIVFLLSAWPKLRHPSVFAQNVIDYRIVPARLASLLAVAMIPLEAFLAIAFLTGFLTNVALPLAAAMLLTFLVAVAINLKRGRRIACGCFGDAGEQISARTLIRLLMLLAVLGLLWIFRSTVSESSPGLAAMTVDIPTLIYLSHVAFLAVFFILVGAWLLSLPELMLLAHHGHGIQQSND